MTKEQTIDQLIELGCLHTRETLQNFSEQTLGNMLIVQQKKVERSINEQLFEMA